MTPLVDGLRHNFAHRSAKNDLLMISDWVDALFKLRQLQQQLVQDQEKIYAKVEKNGFRRSDITRLVHLLEVPAETQARSGEITLALNQCLKHQFKTISMSQPKGAKKAAAIGQYAPVSRPWIPRKQSIFSTGKPEISSYKPLIYKK